MNETPERASPLSDSDPHISSVEESLTLSSADFLPPSSGTRRRSWTTINEGRHARPIADDESPAFRDEIPAPKPPLRGDPLLGMIVADRYRIVEAIGRGGMGVVYKVQHVRIGKLLAMKVLAGEMSHHPEVVRRFKREALAVSKLQSPNTVQVFDFGVSEGLTYLVMELVSGNNLGSILRAEGPMPFARLGKLVIQVCSSLAEAHQKGIVHRDIKPENLMLLSAGDGTELCKVL